MRLGECFGHRKHVPIGHKVRQAFGKSLKTGKYYAGSHDTTGYVYWTDDFNHKWHPPYKYSGNVPPFNELKRLTDAGYKVTAVVIE